MAKKTLLGISFSLFVICLSSFLLASPAFAFSGSGSGTSGDPYQITTCSQLHEIVNNLSADYLMKNDINCNGVSFTPIGDTTSNFFVGKLDGGGHKITNLTINSDENGVGIFEEVGSGGVITNIGYESGSVTSGADSSKLGSFAGVVSGGSITKSYSKASLTANNGGFIAPVAGGLFGVGNSATVSDSYYSGNIVNATGENANDTGGISGAMTGGSITNSYSAGNLANGQDVGGITGVLGTGATLSNSFTTMTLTNDTFVGGMVGNNSGTISTSYFNDPNGGFFPMQCYFGGNTGCTSVVQNIPYFYAISNPPMTSWDFVNTWSTVNNGINYPLLYWQSPNPTPTPTATSTPMPPSGPPSVSSQTSSASSTTQTPVCNDSAPTSAPNLFQLRAKENSVKVYFAPDAGANSGYYIGYGFDDTAQNFGATFNYSNGGGVVAYTINDLFPGTWYFKVRGQNGCMPGAWSGVMKVQVK